MAKIFYNMSSLIYLNIHSFEINSQTSKASSFDNLPSNLKICTNRTNMQNYLLSIGKNYDCNDICFHENNNNNNKLIVEKSKCIDKCEKDSIP